ncbi:ADK-domain-containing protein [Lactarius deliciosus]|nr:ADK-domain-containing protein [Lactarius deliciosus]
MTSLCLRPNTRRRICTREFSTTSRSQTALPFLLGNSRSAAAPDADTGPDSSHPNGRVLRMIMFGKPGAGKGTLTTRLARKHDILSISTGDLLRQHIAEKVVSSKLDTLRHKHWILDGFPRTVGQGKLLDAHLRKQGLPLSLVVNLDVPDDVILARISDRWVHLPSGRVYNLSYNRPRVDGLDDETGEPLTKRPDDNPEVFARRLRQFYASTSPLLQYYGSPRTSLSPDSKPKLVSLREHAVRSIAPSLRERRKSSLSEVVLARDEERRMHRPGTQSGHDH